MICNKCGFEGPDDAKFCPKCGAPVPVEETPAYDYTEAFTPPVEDTPSYTAEPAYNPIPPASPLMNALKDKLFLILCILLTASSGIGLFSGNVDVIKILITIFLWLTFARIKDNAPLTECQGYLRSVSGTVYASYIINNVLAGIMAFSSLIVGFTFTFLPSLPGFSEGFVKGFEDSFVQFYPGYSYSFSELSGPVLAIIGWVFAVLFIIIAAVMLIINIQGMRKIHRFAKSTYQGITDPTVVPENPRTVRNWLIFYGICEAIGLLGTSNVIVGGCSLAATILATVLINRYFLTQE